MSSRPCGSNSNEDLGGKFFVSKYCNYRYWREKVARYSKSELAGFSLDRQANRAQPKALRKRGVEKNAEESR